MDTVCIRSLRFSPNNGVGEADYIGSKVFKMLGQVERSHDLAEIAINLAKLK